MATFGSLLKHYREAQELSLRELATRSEVDHAYIHRLETGSKTTPSADVVDRLIKKLGVDKRVGSVMRLLAGREADDILVELTLEEPRWPLEVFEAAMQASFRGTRPATKDAWRKKLTQIKGILE